MVTEIEFGTSLKFTLDYSSFIHMNFISFCRIGHENFELLNHDIVEPVLLEGKLVRNLLQTTLN